MSGKHNDIEVFFRQIQTKNNRVKIDNSKSDLVKEIKKDGKTIYDSSSWDELEQSYYEEENQNILSNVIEKITGFDLITLIMEMGLGEKEVEDFYK